MAPLRRAARDALAAELVELALTHDPFRPRRTYRITTMKIKLITTADGEAVTIELQPNASSDAVSLATMPAYEYLDSIGAEWTSEMVDGDLEVRVAERDDPIVASTLLSKLRTLIEGELD